MCRGVRTQEGNTTLQLLSVQIQGTSLTIVGDCIHNTGSCGNRTVDIYYHLDVIGVGCFLQHCPYSIILSGFLCSCGHDHNSRTGAGVNPVSHIRQGNQDQIIAKCSLIILILGMSIQSQGILTLLERIFIITGCICISICEQLCQEIERSNCIIAVQSSCAKSGLTIHVVSAKACYKRHPGVILGGRFVLSYIDGPFYTAVF